MCLRVVSKPKHGREEHSDILWGSPHFFVFIRFILLLALQPTLLAHCVLTAYQQCLEFAAFDFRHALHPEKLSVASPSLHKLFAGQPGNMDVFDVIGLYVVAGGCYWGFGHLCGNHLSAAKNRLNLPSSLYYRNPLASYKSAVLHSCKALIASDIDQSWHLARSSSTIVTSRELEWSLEKKRVHNKYAVACMTLQGTSIQSQMLDLWGKK